MSDILKSETVSKPRELRLHPDIFERHELQLPRLLAKLGCFQSVFDVEDWYACGDERQERLAFVELETLLVQRPIEVGDQSGIWSMSFLSPMDSPRWWAWPASHILNFSWLS